MASGSLDAPRVNGNQLSWGSIFIRVDGLDVYGSTEISYGIKRERTKGYGRGPRPRGRTTGKVTYENPKIKMARQTWANLQAYLAAQSADGTSYGNTEFGVFVEGAEETEVFYASLQRCVVVGVSSSDAEGADPSVTEIEVDTMQIKENGLVIYSDGE
jgi:hypothetical protein